LLRFCPFHSRTLPYVFPVFLGSWRDRCGQPNCVGEFDAVTERDVSGGEAGGAGVFGAHHGDGGLEARRKPFSVVGGGLRLFAFVGFQECVAQIDGLWKGQGCFGHGQEIQVVGVVGFFRGDGERGGAVFGDQVVADGRGFGHAFVAVEEGGDGAEGI
jgi:hypothetical protein